MGILRRLMESVDWQHGRHADELLLSGQKEKYGRVSVFAGEDYLLAYDYQGDAFTVDLTPFAGKKLTAHWMNPVSGVMSYFADFTGENEAQVKPVARLTRDNDWVLVIRAWD